MTANLSVMSLSHLMTGTRQSLSTFLRKRAPIAYLLARKLYRFGGNEPLHPTSRRILTAVSPGRLMVRTGPFAGMKYLPFSSGSPLIPKVIGCYEMELHPAIAESLSRRPERIVNIGAGEGYYAVGYALRLPAAQVFAYDTDVLARDQLRRLAAENDVRHRIHIATRCTHRDLEDVIGTRTLIVCDCEGGERELLDPERAPRLCTTDLLVEVHIERDPDIVEILGQRFQATHSQARIPMTNREHMLPALARLSTEDRAAAVFERTERTEWLWLTCFKW